MRVILPLSWFVILALPTALHAQSVESTPAESRAAAAQAAKAGLKIATATVATPLAPVVEAADKAGPDKTPLKVDEDLVTKEPPPPPAVPKDKRP